MRPKSQAIMYAEAYLDISKRHPTVSLRKRARAAEQRVSSDAWVAAITRNYVIEEDEQCSGT